MAIIILELYRYHNMLALYSTASILLFILCGPVQLIAPKHHAHTGRASAALLNLASLHLASSLLPGATGGRSASLSAHPPARLYVFLFVLLISGAAAGSAAQAFVRTP